DEGGYVTDVIRILLHQGVEVQRATGNFSVRDAKDYWDGTRKAVNFSAGDYIISADQPRHLFVHSLLQRNLAIEDSVMYDMATWSAPLAYNLEAYSSRQVASYPAETVDMDEVNWGGRISLTAEPYAFVIDWDQRWAPRALAMLWEKGYRVRAAVEPFGDEAHTFSAGSLIILRGRNLEKSEVLRADMAEIAEQAGVTVVAKATGRMLDGYDLASTRNVPVDQPKVAMLVEPPFDTYTAGQVYFLFDQDTRLPVDRIRTSVLQQTALPRFGSRYGYADLNDYDVLILPDARINALKEVFNGNALESLKDWLRRGGTIVAMEGAAGFFTAETKFNELVWAGTDRDTSEEARRVTYGERERYYGLQRIPGSALQGHIDTTNPLGFGLHPRVYTLRSGSDALAPDANLQAVGTYGEDSSELLVAGYASASNLDHLRAKVFAGVSEYGQGKIVYLVDNPHFRMFWRGPSRLMQNAVMLVPGF
ncbi:MAG: peptidase M14, partial [Lewinella sp.]|nr:peptidase M14 [Lewinella sp.]